MTNIMENPIRSTPTNGKHTVRRRSSCVRAVLDELMLILFICRRKGSHLRFPPPGTSADARRSPFVRTTLRASVPVFLFTESCLLPPFTNNALFSQNHAFQQQYHALHAFLFLYFFSLFILIYSVQGGRNEISASD